jgi:hypothetical protein
MYVTHAITNQFLSLKSGPSSFDTALAEKDGYEPQERRRQDSEDPLAYVDTSP